MASIKRHGQRLRWYLRQSTSRRVTQCSRVITREHWVTLRDVLWRKYQRKRCPWRFIEAIDKLLEDMPEEEEAGSPGEEDGQ